MQTPCCPNCTNKFNVYLIETVSTLVNYNGIDKNKKVKKYKCTYCRIEFEK